MERSLGLAFTTLTIFAPLAQAAHPQQAIKPRTMTTPPGPERPAVVRPQVGGAGLAMALAWFGVLPRRRR